MAKSNTGTVWERTVRAVYEVNEFTVIRSAGSKGPADLIAWDESVVYLIQCKKESKKNNYKEDADRLRVVPVPKFQKWVKVLWIKRKRDVIVRYLGEEVHEDQDKHMSIGDINKRLKNNGSN